MTETVLFAGFCSTKRDTRSPSGIMIEGMVCAGDGYSSELVIDAADLAKRCQGPISGADVSLANGFATTTSAEGRFMLGPIPHGVLSEGTISVRAIGYSGFSGIPTAEVIPRETERSGHAWILNTLPDGSDEFVDFRGHKSSMDPDMNVKSISPPDPWSTGGVLLRDALQRAIEGLSIVDLSGRHWSKADFLGKITLVEIWGTWCAPCRIEVPRINDAVHRLGGSRFQALGIAILEKDSGKFRKWCIEHGVNWPQAVTAEDVDAPMLKAFALRGVPTSILVGRDGRVLGANLRARKLLPVLTELVAEPDAKSVSE